MRHWVVLILFLLGLGALRVVGCGDYGNDEGCELDTCPPCEGIVCPPDENECTIERCSCGVCVSSPVEDGTLCSPDDNECTIEYCSAGECLSKPVTDGRACTFKGLFPGVCVSGFCGKDLCAGVDCDDEPCSEG